MSNEKQGELVKYCIFIVTLPTTKRDEWFAELFAKEIKKLGPNIKVRWMWELDKDS